MKLFVISPPPELLEFYWGKPTLLTCEMCNKPVDPQQVFFQAMVISIQPFQSVREHGYWMSVCDSCGDLTILNAAVQVAR